MTPGSNRFHMTPASSGSPKPSSAQAQVLELWDDIKGALIGVASTRVMNFLGELVPGFDEHYRRAEQRMTRRLS